MVYGTREEHGRASGWKATDVLLATGKEAEVVFVVHVDAVDLPTRSGEHGARPLTANYQPGYWGANGLSLQMRRDGHSRSV